MKTKIFTVIAAISIAVLCVLSVFFCYRYYKDVFAPQKELDNKYSEQQILIDRIKPRTETYINALRATVQDNKNEDLTRRQSIRTDSDLLKDCKEVNEIQSNTF